MRKGAIDWSSVGTAENNTFSFGAVTFAQEPFV